MESIKQTVGENLKKVCKTKGLKNYQVADYMGVTEGCVSHWFRGDNSIDIDNLYRLCQFLGVSLDQIFGIEPLISDIISKEECVLLEAYRKADDRAREDAIKTLCDHPRKKEEPSAI